jgi:hypothetical protein
MWQRTGLMWGQQGDDTWMNWADPESYCGSLSLGGYTDWRLPTKKELMSIVDYGTSQPPSIDTTYFPGTGASHYVTSTPSACPFEAGSEWFVGFGNGAVNSLFIDSDYNVRCVRGEQQPAHGFTNNGNGTVTDKVTGLMWQRCSAGQQNDAACSGTASGKTWQAAMDYCSGLSLAGHTDWRLPNVKELESITDDTSCNPAIDSDAFPGVSPSEAPEFAAAGIYWSSTTYPYSTSNAQVVYFLRGLVSGDSKAYDFFLARCVR